MVLLYLLPILHPQQARSAQVKFFFTGTITNSPCDIAPGDDAITVPFGQISYRKLNTANATTDSKPFTIHLQNCAFDPNETTIAGSAGKCLK